MSHTRVLLERQTCGGRRAALQIGRDRCGAAAETGAEAGGLLLLRRYRLRHRRRHPPLSR